MNHELPKRFHMVAVGRTVHIGWRKSSVPYAIFQIDSPFGIKHRLDSCYIVLVVKRGFRKRADGILRVHC